jgi:hypothetical protein
MSDCHRPCAENHRRDPSTNQKRSIFRADEGRPRFCSVDGAKDGANERRVSVSRDRRKPSACRGHGVAEARLLAQYRLHDRPYLGDTEVNRLVRTKSPIDLDRTDLRNHIDLGAAIDDCRSAASARTGDPHLCIARLDRERKTGGGKDRIEAFLKGGGVC